MDDQAPPLPSGRVRVQEAGRASKMSCHRQLRLACGWLPHVQTPNDPSSETAEGLRSVARRLHGGGKAEAEAAGVTRAAAPERFSAAPLFAVFSFVLFC